MKIDKIDLRKLGATLAVDSDHALTTAPRGAVVLIRLAPQDNAYPEERHEAREGIVCLEGRLALVADGERVDLSQGECCRVPVGLAHRWSSESNGLVLVHFGE